ncbi:hypothetical protein [Sphingorhabdus sp.]|uniref:hypothetical protein n=1 Tax=Sphingorhabdus sp. TaxID=1902408 RepID=UPI0035943320
MKGIQRATTSRLMVRAHVFARWSHPACGSVISFSFQVDLIINRLVRVLVKITRISKWTTAIMESNFE